ncbi:MAG: NAD(P)/FAD-dependent oxidoreductase [archaeon]|nr:NAD(P)/FAD-dependent oxidoreductase [archaeon]
MADVVVVGGGPAGSRTAAILARKYDVVVLEDHPFSGVPMQCAGIVTKTSIDLSGAKPRILNKFTGAEVIFPNGKSIIVRSHDDKAVLIDRVDFDRKLAEIAIDAGAEFRYSTKYKGHSINSGTARVCTSADDINTKLIVGADGHSSKVSNSISNNQPTEFIRGLEYDVQHTMEVQDLIRIRIGTDIAPGLFSWEIPFGEYTRVGLCTTLSAGPPSEYMKVLLSKSELRNKKIIAKYSGKIPMGIKRRIYANNVMLIGDAACHVKPVSAGGIYPIMKSVIPLCQTAEEAFAMNNFSEKVLSKYYKRWNHEIGKELKLSYIFRKTYLGFNNSDMNNIYPYMKSVNEVLNSVDIDRPNTSVIAIFHNISVAIKLISVVIKSKVRK